MIDVNARMAIDTIIQLVSSIDFYNRYNESYGSSDLIKAQLALLKDTVINMKKAGYDENDIHRFKMMYQHLLWLFEGVQDRQSQS